MKKILLLCILFGASTAIAKQEPNPISPQFKHVKLEEFTAMTLDIMPHAGTQLIFPFVLDNPDLQPLLKIELTNPDGFEVPHDSGKVKALLSGQNTITITGKKIEKDPTVMGNLFISIGGYNLSISLRSTLDVRNHVSNIVFDVTEKERDHLIENIIKKRTKQLEANYQEKLQKLEDKAQSQALKHISLMATEKPDYDNFKIEDEIEFDEERIIVFIDKIIQYGSTYSVLLFELDNRSNKDFQTNNIEIRALTEKREIPIQGSFNCPKALKSDSVLKCSFATTQGDTLDRAKELKLDLITDRGTGSIIW